MFTVATKNNIINDLDQIAIQLSFSQMKLEREELDKSYVKMLRLSKNLSSKKQCSNFGCNSLFHQLRRCANCKKKYYCSRRCQKIDWKKDKNHAQKCSRAVQ